MIFTKQFIKVTPKDGGHAVVVPASNEPFYLAQGAKIEEPTKEEIIKYFPELGCGTSKPKGNAINVENEELHEIIATLEQRNRELEAEVERLKATSEETEQPKVKVTRRRNPKEL